MIKADGNPYGTHRAIEPAGSLPQPAWKLDNTTEIWDNEVLIEVETLNVDAASFRQISQVAQGDPDVISQIIMETVAKRGKQHNPVTGSGGMLIGSVAKLGKSLVGKRDLAMGDRIATLVSLSLTPLNIQEILAVHSATCQVDVRAKAVLFESGIYAKLPSDMPDKLALAVLDVAGAPAQTAKIVSPSQKVLIIGGGKSGLLCLHEAKKRAGITGKVIIVDYAEQAVARLKQSGLADVVLQGDARDAIAIHKLVEEATDGALADVTINCVDIPGTEMTSILSTRNGGLVYFFSMATSFTAAALGAEGIGKDVTMLIGNGYTEGHSAIAINVLRENPGLRTLFSNLYT